MFPIPSSLSAPFFVADSFRPEQEIIALETKKFRAIERAAGRDARVARQLQKIDSYGHNTRERRLRTVARRVDYVYDAEEDEEGGEGDEGDYEPEAAGSAAGGKRGRSGSEMDDVGEEVEHASSAGGSVAGSAGGGRRTKQAKGAPPPAPEWRGERRSSRMRLKADGEDDDMNSPASVSGPPPPPLVADSEPVADAAAQPGVEAELDSATVSELDSATVPLPLDVVPAAEAAPHSEANGNGISSSSAQSNAIPSTSPSVKSGSSSPTDVTAFSEVDEGFLAKKVGEEEVVPMEVEEAKVE